MTVSIFAIASESGVPIFTRKSADAESLQYSTIASLHGVNMYCENHNAFIQHTKIENGHIEWLQCSKSVNLIGIAKGEMKMELHSLLSFVYDTMVFFVGKKQIETVPNVEQLKKELRPAYVIIDYFIESIEGSSVSGTKPTLFLDLIESLIFPRSNQLQNALENYMQCVSGRWSSLIVHGRVVSVSRDWSTLNYRDAKLLQLIVMHTSAPLKDTPVFLPYSSPDIAYRAITCKLLSDVYVVVVCGATPTLSEIDEIVLKCWENYADLLKEAKLCYPKIFPDYIHFEPSIMCVMIINIKEHRCFISKSLHQGGQQRVRIASGTHKVDIMRSFYVNTVRKQLIPEFENHLDENEKNNDLLSAIETYWCSEHHKCHAKRTNSLVCCVVYASAVPTHTIRILTNQLLQEFISYCKEHSGIMKKF